MATPARRVATTLLLMVVLGVLTGQAIGHLLAAGIEDLLGVTG